MVGPQEPEVGDPTRGNSGNFLQREPDGSARVRIRFTAEEAASIEEAAGTTPVLLYIHRVLAERSRYHKRKQKEDAERRRQRQLANADGGNHNPAPPAMDGHGPG